MTWRQALQPFLRWTNLSAASWKRLPQELPQRPRARLSTAEAKELANYVRRHPDGEVFDLSQSCAKRRRVVTTGGPLFTVTTKNNSYYVVPAKACLSEPEVCASMGYPHRDWPELVAAMGVPAHLLPPLRSVGQTATRTMLGNGMHMCCVGAVLLAARMHLMLD
jgi:hypothetical protein